MNVVMFLFFFGYVKSHRQGSGEFIFVLFVLTFYNNLKKKRLLLNIKKKEKEFFFFVTNSSSACSKTPKRTEKKKNTTATPFLPSVILFTRCCCCRCVVGLSRQSGKMPFVFARTSDPQLLPVLLVVVRDMTHFVLWQDGSLIGWYNRKKILIL